MVLWCLAFKEGPLRSFRNLLHTLRVFLSLYCLLLGTYDLLLTSSGLTHTDQTSTSQSKYTGGSELSYIRLQNTHFCLASSASPASLLISYQCG